MFVACNTSPWDVVDTMQSIYNPQSSRPQQNGKKKSAADFLGDNANLVNLDNLVSISSTSTPSSGALSSMYLMSIFM